MKVLCNVAFVFSVGLRFVPFIFSELDSIKEAQRLRGLAIEQMRWYRRVPLFASLLPSHVGIPYEGSDHGRGPPI